MHSELPISLPAALPPDAELEPDWKIYESAIAHIEESYKNCTVIRNYKLEGKSGVERQVDVWLSAEIGDNHVVTVAVECRRYSDRPVSIKDIDAFSGFLDDVRANKGVMISNTGFTEGAKKRAENADIELRMLTLEEANEFDWEEFISDPCESGGGCFGTVSWDYQDGGSEAGWCHSCGTFHIRCGNCGEVGSYDENRLVKCSGCAMRWELQMEKDMTCGIKELPPEKEEEEDEGEEE